MAKKLLLLHVGPTSVDLEAMTDALSLGRVAIPAVAPDALAHAGLEIRRTHKQAGLKRKQVEGTWAHICRRVHKAKADCFISVPDFFDATPEQAALALDQAAGLKIVLVLTTGFDVEPPAAWVSLIKDDRTHVLPSHLSDEQLAAQIARIALIEEESRLGKRLATIGKRRRQVNRRLAA